MFMERSIMTDSLTNSLLLLSISLLLLKKNFVLKEIFAGFLLGYMIVMRSNYLLLSIGVLTVFIIKTIKEKRLLSLTLLVVSYFIVIFSYSVFFVHPRLDTYKVSSFTGILVFSRLARHFSCEDLRISSEFNSDFQRAISNVCTQKLVSEPYYKMLWNRDGLILGIEKHMNITRTVSDDYFRRLSWNLLRQKYSAFVSELLLSLNEPFVANNAFYNNNYFPSWGGGCEYINKFIGIENEKFINLTNENLSLLRVKLFSEVAKWSQKGIYLSSLFVLMHTIHRIIVLIRRRLFIKGVAMVIILGSWLSYITSSLFLAGFDYRYLQPLVTIFILQLFVEKSF